MTKMETRKIAYNQKNPLLNEWYNERMTVAIYPDGPSLRLVKLRVDWDYIMKIGQFNNEISSNKRKELWILSFLEKAPVAPVWSRRRKEVRKRNIPHCIQGSREI